MNFATIAVLAAVILVSALVVRYMVKENKKSKASGGCGGSCAGCSGCSHHV